MVLKRTKIIFATLILFNIIVSCSVVPRKIRSESVSTVPFHKLLEEVDNFIGKTVILGGYILKAENLPDKTTLIVLQAPLSWTDEPKSKDLSEGRFIVYHRGFLDPEVYKKDRKITVAGNVTGILREEFGKTSYVYLKIESRSLYLWPQPEYDYRYPYDYYWYHPHPYYRWYHPYYPYHPFYW